MEIQDRSAFLRDQPYRGPFRHKENAAGTSVPRADTAVLSAEGRRAAAEWEPQEILATEPSPHSPKQPGGLDIPETDTFDWDSWEPPTLEKGEGHERWMDEIDQDEYRKKKMEAVVRNFQEIENRVKAYYRPEYDKIKNMGKDQALEYLYDTYQRPFSGRGNSVRFAPNGMSKQEADMAYNQLFHLYLYDKALLPADAYALRPSDIRDLNTAESRAKQEVDPYYKGAWEAAHPDDELKKEKAQRKAAFRKMVETITRTNLKDLPSSACLSQEVLSLPAKGPETGFTGEA